MSGFLRAAFGLFLLSAALFVAASAPVPATLAEDEKPAATERREPRGRLPRYYAQVVTQKQREQIYAIQQQYTGSIAELEQQIDSLVAKRDAEVRAVLSPEQQHEVDELYAEAERKREAAKAEKERQQAADAAAGAQ